MSGAAVAAVRIRLFVTVVIKDPPSSKTALEFCMFVTKTIF